MPMPRWGKTKGTGAPRSRKHQAWWGQILNRWFRLNTGTWVKHRGFGQAPGAGSSIGLSPGGRPGAQHRDRTFGREVLRSKQKAPEAPFVVRGGGALDEVVQDALDFALFLRTQGQDLAAVVGDHNGVLKLG